MSRDVRRWGGGGGGGSSPGSSAKPVVTFTADHAAGVGTLGWKNITGAEVTFTKAYATLGTPVTVDAATVIDVNVDGTSAVTPFSIPLGASDSAVEDVSVVVADGSELTIDVDSVGTPGAGETIMVQLA